MVDWRCRIRPARTTDRRRWYRISIVLLPAFGEGPPSGVRFPGYSLSLSRPLLLVVFPLLLLPATPWQALASSVLVGPGSHTRASVATGRFWTRSISGVDNYNFTGTNHRPPVPPPIGGTVRPVPPRVRRPIQESPSPRSRALLPMTGKRPATPTPKPNSTGTCWANWRSTDCSRTSRSGSRMQQSGSSAARPRRRSAVPSVDTPRTRSC